MHRSADIICVNSVEHSAILHLQSTLCIVLQLNINVTNGKAKLRSQEDE
jgi:hypothetical protein